MALEKNPLEFENLERIHYHCRIVTVWLNYVALVKDSPFYMLLYLVLIFVKFPSISIVP